MGLKKIKISAKTTPIPTIKVSELLRLWPSRFQTIMAFQNKNTKLRVNPTKTTAPTKAINKPKMIPKVWLLKTEMSWTNKTSSAKSEKLASQPSMDEFRLRIKYVHNVPARIKKMITVGISVTAKSNTPFCYYISVMVVRQRILKPVIKKWLGVNSGSSRHDDATKKVTPIA